MALLPKSRRYGEVSEVLQAGHLERRLASKKDILRRMEANPQADWRIGDFETVAKQLGLSLKRPKRGSHHTVSSEYLPTIETVPFKRPIKAIYVRRFVKFAKAHIAAKGRHS